jgi:hypothetical protein
MICPFFTISAPLNHEPAPPVYSIFQPLETIAQGIVDFFQSLEFFDPFFPEFGKGL